MVVTWLLSRPWLSGWLRVSPEAAALPLFLVKCGLCAEAGVEWFTGRVVGRGVFITLVSEQDPGVHHQSPWGAPHPRWLVTKRLALFPQGFGCEGFPCKPLQGMPSCLQKWSMNHCQWSEGRGPAVCFLFKILS